MIICLERRGTVLLMNISISIFSGPATHSWYGGPQENGQDFMDNIYAFVCQRFRKETNSGLVDIARAQVTQLISSQHVANVTHIANMARCKPRPWTI